MDPRDIRPKLTARLALAAAAILSLPALDARAADGTTSARGTTIADGTTTVDAAVSVAQTETAVSGGTLMLVSYIVLWILIFGFMIGIARRQARLDRELDDLEARMDDLFEDGALDRELATPDEE
jgi:CcmD family protein